MSTSSSHPFASAKIYVAGHRGMVGSAILRQLQAQGSSRIVTCTRNELDLTAQESVFRFFRDERPEIVFLAAAKVGGILANSSRPADFIYDNLVIQTNILHAAREFGVQRLLFLGSSCIYPRDCPQPIREEYLLTGPLEPTNRPYAVAKIAGIETCHAFNRQYGTRFIAAMPTNLYGPNDNYDLTTSHVLPALIRKMHEAKVSNRASVEVWGTGSVRREFLHVDDLAAACLFLMSLPEEHFDPLVRSETESPLLNIGCGEDLTIRELAELIRKVVGFEGNLVFDASKPDGTPRKLLDIDKIKKLGWQPRISLEQGVASVYGEFCASLTHA
jgi:GDP-L-fucose synthase